MFRPGPSPLDVTRRVVERRARTEGGTRGRIKCVDDRLLFGVDSKSLCPLQSPSPESFAGPPRGSGRTTGFPSATVLDWSAHYLLSGV